MKSIAALFLAGCAAAPAAPLGGELPDLVAPAVDFAHAPRDMAVPPMVKHSILPSDTDPKINTPNYAHTAIAPGGAGNGRLLAFFRARAVLRQATICFSVSRRRLVITSSESDIRT